MSSTHHWLRAASVGFLILIPVLSGAAVTGVVLFWGFGIDHLGNAALGENFVVLASAPPVAERRVYGLVATLPALTFWLWSMWRLFQMFLGFTAGTTVGIDTVKHLRSFSLFSLLAVVSGFLLSGVMRWAAGVFDNAPLWTHLGFSTTHAAMLFLSAIIFVASHIIEEGYTYKKETEEYV